MSCNAIVGVGPRIRASGWVWHFEVRGCPAGVCSSERSGDATPCRMTGVTLHSNVGRDHAGSHLHQVPWHVSPYVNKVGLLSVCLSLHLSVSSSFSLSFSLSLSRALSLSLSLSLSFSLSQSISHTLSPSLSISPSRALSLPRSLPLSRVAPAT